MLDLVEEALDPMAQLAGSDIVWNGDLARSFGGDDGLGTAVGDECAQVVVIGGLAGDDAGSALAGEKLRRFMLSTH